MTAREFSLWFFEGQNWRWVMFIALFVVAIPISIYHFATIDSELWDDGRRSMLKQKLSEELDRIELPQTTAISKRQDSFKQFMILISRRYRTELQSDELIPSIDAQLKGTGWRHYATKSTERIYCRGIVDAYLRWEGRGGIFSDNGNYWSLEFVAGVPPRDTRPLECDSKHEN